ncbi:putative uncharacterized protein DDB_G0289963 [Ricinus communis]|uniref:DUF7356 domain-containing protein n=1 Tax=Ricinus communis TaxID=3988 RepID=B9RCR9_RICCO|nr:putative uncharacterized protein DDB_G0289963 [Ricinus communis]EEF51340.1 conserved hypothetical protein [Ricinus communis]|eukprot:XP_002509953.1 putative uncharacterized protein DDB_G0289963 [Ricinus communis]
MGTNRALYLGLIVLLLVVDCSILDFKVNVSAKTDSQSNSTKDSNDQGGELSSFSDSNGVNKEKKRKENQVDDLKEKIGGDMKNNKNNLSSQSGSKKDDMKTNNINGNDLNSQSESKKTDNSERKVEDDDSKKKTIPKENNINQGDSGLASKDSHVEECDPSNKCTDEENQLVACLRVPGNDQYSLLVQNKGKNPLTVTISAPDYVHIEKTEIQLQSKEDKKVPVSIRHGGNDNLIVLRTGNGRCNLDIKHLVTENFLDISQKSGYINYMSRTPVIAVLAFAALLILAAGWTCISFRRKQLSSSGSKYQRLDMELPVSTGEKAESEQNDGWDDKWGDDWDDEEAPKTPSLPVTPSLSSKGLASRRLSKEGWKD